MIQIIDGGLSTQLESQGVDLTLHPKLWTAGLLSSVDGRTELLAAHNAFLHAGADVILTASYQTSPDLPVDILHHSVRLALEARDAVAVAQGGRTASVFVSLGPWGATQADGSEYTGQYASVATKDFLTTFHKTRLSLLLGGAGAGGAGGANNSQVDGLAFETIPSSLELESILPLLSSSCYSSLPGWITFSSKDGIHLCDGSLLSSAVERCIESFAAGAGAAASGAAASGAGAQGKRYIGLNCVDPQYVDAFLDAVLPLLSSHESDGVSSVVSGVVLYPNNGGTWNAIDRCWNDPLSLEESGGGSGGGGGGYIQKAKDWRDRVISEGMCVMIGGCCSTDAKTIRKLRECLICK